MYTLLIVLHVIFCVFLILVILLQTGKGAGMGAAFGGASQTVFGPRGAGSFIGKITGVVAALFMLTSLVLAYMSSSGSTGVAEKAAALNEQRSRQVEEVSIGSEAATETPAEPADEAPVEAPQPSQGDAGTAPGAAADAGTQAPAEPEATPEAKPEAPAEPAAPANQPGDVETTAP